MRNSSHLERTKVFLNNHSPTLVVLVLVICALVFFEHYWDDPARMQAVGALFGFFTAAILVGVTWEYVKINQKSLSLRKPSGSSKAALCFFLELNTITAERSFGLPT
jgi:hypothetical protein